jgi:hypothetical protein
LALWQPEDEEVDLMNSAETKLMVLGALAWLVVVPAASTAGIDRALTKRDMAVHRIQGSNLQTRQAVGQSGAMPDLSAPETAQLLPNGDFEQGQTIWTEFSQNGWDIILSQNDPTTPPPEVPHSGDWLAWLGGDFDEVSYIEQQVMVPVGTSSLIYWHWIDSEDICDFDFATVSVNGSELERYSLCEDSNTLGWVLHEVDISSSAGQMVTIRIRVDTDATWNSNFFVDDVSIEVSDEGIFSDGFESGDVSAWSSSIP